MAELLDWEEDKEPVQEDNPETKDEALRAIAEEPEAKSEDDNTEDTLPEKYRGKSVQDLVRMHQEAEKAIGRKGSEVGELRKVVDEYIKAQSEVQQAPTQPVAEETVDWFDDPDKALETRLANDPRLKSIEQDRVQAKRERNLAELERKHPDYKELVNDPAFADWVTQSKVRTRLFLDADQKYDSDAADELFTTWKERKHLTASTVEADKNSRKDAARAASNGGATGSGQPQTKKKFRRADVIKLMNSDPDRYALMADEILLAYKEGRVI
jgi:hypothetical protein